MAGVNASVAMVSAVVMDREGVDVVRAVQWVASRRMCASISNVFYGQLKEFELVLSAMRQGGDGGGEKRKGEEGGLYDKRRHMEE
jgi:hypothetical protein